MRPCKYPFVKDKVFYGCGKCVPCLITRRKTWIHRLILEQYQHQSSTFVTLTYDDKHIPEGGTLVPKDLTDWLKRFRKALSPLNIRYYAVGEYGENTERPHYHVIIFGSPGCFRPYVRKGEACPCATCRVYQRTWNKGFSFVGDVTEQSLKYVASYVSKSTLKSGDRRLFGRNPEFARMSLKPGIGYAQAKNIVNTLTTDAGCDIMETIDDVPFSITHGNISYPLGNYLRRKIRKELGHDEKAPPCAIQKQKEKVQELLRENNVPNPKTSMELSSALRSIFKNPVSKIESRHKIFKQKKEI